MTEFSTETYILYNRKIIRRRNGLVQNISGRNVVVRNVRERNVQVQKSRGETSCVQNVHVQKNPGAKRPGLKSIRPGPKYQGAKRPGPKEDREQNVLDQKWQGRNDLVRNVRERKRPGPKSPGAKRLGR